MIRVVVLEQNSPAVEHLVRLLADFCHVDIIGTATDDVAGYNLCLNLRPDAAFVDINLSAQDGTPLAPKLAALPRPPLLVFTASNSDRAADAFRLGSVDFFMKSLDRLHCSDNIKRLLAQLR